MAHSGHVVKMAAPVRRALLFRAAAAWAFSGYSRCLSGSTAARAKWRLLGALCLQRPPSLAQTMSAEENEMAELLQQVGKSSVCACAWTLDSWNVYACSGCDQLYQCRMLRIYHIGFGDGWKTTYRRSFPLNFNRGSVKWMKNE